MAACTPPLSATSPARADPADWPTIVPDPTMVITVDERPCGLRSAASENTVTTVGPTPIPASAIAATTPGSPPASAKAIIAASISVEEASHRAQRRNRSGSSAMLRARTVEPTPITP